MPPPSDLSAARGDGTTGLTSHFRIRTGALATVTVALAVMVTACGGSSSKAATPPAGAPTTTAAGGAGRATAAALTAFRTCMQTQGVTLPTVPARTRPAGSPPSSRPAGSGRPAGAGGGAGFGAGGGAFAGGGFGNVFSSTDPKTQAAVKACQDKLPAGFLQAQTTARNAQAAFDSCMKDHGVTITTAAAGAPPVTIDRTSAAYKVCSVLLPARPNRGASPTTTAP
jgi:hypothetical protein